MSPLASLHVVLSYILQLKATKHFSIVKARIIQDGTVIYGLWWFFSVWWCSHAGASVTCWRECDGIHVKRKSKSRRQHRVSRDHGPRRVF